LRRAALPTRQRAQARAADAKMRSKAALPTPLDEIGGCYAIWQQIRPAGAMLYHGRPPHPDGTILAAVQLNVRAGIFATDYGE